MNNTKLKRKKLVKMGDGDARLQFSVVFRSEPEGGFTVLVPELPGCITYGKDLDEAQEMAREAIELYLEDMQEHGEEIPEGARAYLGSVEVSLGRSR